MTPSEYRQRVREATAKWNKRYAGRVPNEYPAGSAPHDGHETDYAEHHALVSYPEQYAYLLDEELEAITTEYLAPGNAQNRRQA